jgi:hypothetical protein
MTANTNVNTTNEYIWVRVPTALPSLHHRHLSNERPTASPPARLSFVVMVPGQLLVVFMPHFDGAVTHRTDENRHNCLRFYRCGTNGTSRYRRGDEPQGTACPPGALMETKDY